MTDTIQQRVARGVAVLDHFLPDWEFRVDLEILDIGSCDRCLLAQLAGGYGKGAVNLFGEGTTVEDLTTTTALRSRACGFVTDHAALTAEWKRVILERRTAALAQHLSIEEALKR